MSCGNPRPAPDAGNRMFYGIDGCPAGWIVIGLDGAGDYRVERVERFSALAGLIAESRLTLVDMPIGLPSRAVPDRVCDRAARRLLGRRASSVFPVPARATLAAADYAEACDINSGELGQKISRQSWNILSRIGEIDALFGTAEVSQRQLREMHPEVAFTALNDGVPMGTSKKSAEGRQQRMGVLERWLSAAPAIAALARARFPRRSELADDDILDALVGAVTATHLPRLATLPGKPVRDERGLAMEIVYAQTQYDR